MPRSASIQVHGHRGARAVRPENTLEAFRYAVSVGADFIEMDVNVTRDGVAVISHDPVLRSGETIRGLEFAEMRRIDATVPTLDEVLQIEGIRFNIEMKSFGDPLPADCAALLDAAIRRCGVAERAMVQSFDFGVTRAMRRIAPGIRLAALVETEVAHFTACVREADADMMAPMFRLVTAGKVEAAHAAGIPVIPWTVNSPADWARMVDAGVDGIITDDPAGLIAWLCERGLR